MFKRVLVTSFESMVSNDPTDDVDTNESPLRDLAGATLLGRLPISIASADESRYQRN